MLRRATRRDGAVALGAHLLHGRELASLMLWDVATPGPWGSPSFRRVAEHVEVLSAIRAWLGCAEANVLNQWVD
ncbi:MAG TPA: hypothetical protein VK039_12435 [Brevibacterium sp.]|nr:hypothetical protein [Brevibacterium sp.]